MPAPRRSCGDGISPDYHRIISRSVDAVEFFDSWGVVGDEYGYYDTGVGPVACPAPCASLPLVWRRRVSAVTLEHNEIERNWGVGVDSDSQPIPPLLPQRHGQILLQPRWRRRR